MNENNSIEANDKTKFRLSEIIGFENYFHQEINQRKTCSKKVNNYVTVFNYINKVLIFLSAATSGASIISVTKYCWSTSWNSKLNFNSNNRNNLKTTEQRKKQKEKA